MERTFVTIEKIGDYKRAAKSFIKGLTKSKLFTSPENEIKVYIEKEDFDKKAKQGIVKLCLYCPVTGMYGEYVINAPTRVYNKIDVELFTSLAEQYARMKTPLKLIFV